MSSTNRKLSPEYKLKVLQYYFLHGGDATYGLKKQTAVRFGIDKKTITRMMTNEELLKSARAFMKKNHPNVKTNINTSTNPSKPKPKSAKIPSSNPPQVKPKPTNSPLTNTKQFIPSNSNIKNNAYHPNVFPQEAQVFELPEDPDYSVLKKSIINSISEDGVVGLFKLLLNGTQEVKDALLNECDIILECKVCRNLFRSIVNFLAHKRIYCQEDYKDVRSLFHRGNVDGLTTESNTLIIEPEPPSDLPKTNPPVPNVNTTVNKDINLPKTSSPVNKESSSYLERLENVNKNRSFLSKNCSVVLEDIQGVSTAVYQVHAAPSETLADNSVQDQLKEIAAMQEGETAVVNEKGSIVSSLHGKNQEIELEKMESVANESIENLACDTCDKTMESLEALEKHQRSVHGIERTVYTCPLCQSQFMHYWSVIKHLKRVHGKSKQQTERFRSIIKENMFKKVIVDKKAGDNDVVEIINNTSAGKSIITSQATNLLFSSSSKSSVKIKEEEFSDMDEDDSFGQDSKFKYVEGFKLCSGENPISPKLKPSIAEKKIGIQIRKDYPKPTSNNTATHLESPAETYIFTKLDELIPMMTSQMTCIPCKRQYSSFSSLKRHLSIHANLTRFKCMQCDLRFFNKYLCKRHIVSEHYDNEEPNDYSDLILEEENLGPLQYYLDDSGQVPDKTKSEEVDDKEKLSDLVALQNKKEDKKKKGSNLDALCMKISQKQGSNIASDDIESAEDILNRKSNTKDSDSDIEITDSFISSSNSKTNENDFESDFEIVDSYIPSKATENNKSSKNPAKTPTKTPSKNPSKTLKFSTKTPIKDTDTPKSKKSANTPNSKKSAKRKSQENVLVIDLDSNDEVELKESTVSALMNGSLHTESDNEHPSNENQIEPKKKICKFEPNKDESKKSKIETSKDESTKEITNIELTKEESKKSTIETCEDEFKKEKTSKDESQKGKTNVDVNIANKISEDGPRKSSRRKREPSEDSKKSLDGDEAKDSFKSQEKKLKLDSKAKSNNASSERKSTNTETTLESKSEKTVQNKSKENHATDKISDKSDSTIEKKKQPKSDTTTDKKKENKSDSTTDKKKEPKSDNTTDKKKEPKSDGTTDKKKEPKSDSTTDKKKEPKSDGTTDKKKEPKSDNTTDKKKETVTTEKKKEHKSDSTTDKKKESKYDSTVTSEKKKEPKSSKEDSTPTKSSSKGTSKKDKEENKNKYVSLKTNINEEEFDGFNNEDNNITEHKLSIVKNSLVNGKSPTPSGEKNTENKASRKSIDKDQIKKRAMMLAMRNAYKPKS